MDSIKKAWPFGKKRPSSADEVVEKLHSAEEKVATKVSSKAPYIRSFCNGSIVGYIVGLLATSKPLLAKGQVKTWLLSQLLTGVAVGVLWTLGSHMRKRRWLRKA